MYRFRKIDNLFKFNELENQEIYFSDISSLNDPMEGYRQYFWQGDTILWKNFLKHYLLCFHNMLILAYLDGDINPDNIPVFMSEEHLPTDELRKVFRRICERFFHYDGISDYLHMLSNRSQKVKIGLDEIVVHLKLLHMLAFKVILTIHSEEKLRPPLPTDFYEIKTHINELAVAWAELDAVSVQEQEELIYVVNKILEELSLMLFVEYDDFKIQFILNRFPYEYINQIKKLVYPETYVACFSEDYTNAVLWAHYADGHKGVCLKFRSTEHDGKQFIELNNKHGWQKFEFHKVNYVNDLRQFVAIDFFKSLGRLTYKQLMSQWYTDEEGNQSQFSSHLNNIEEWRKHHWRDYEEGFLKKLKDWEYEKERRLILCDLLNDHINTEDRKFKYKFEDLEAIIFGAKTPFEDKKKIIEIIEAKCRANNRSEFDFYQADFSSVSGTMKINKLSFITF